MSLDFVAKRYGVLPSYAMKFGDSVDVRCANISVMYESYLNRKQEGGWKDKSDHGLSQDDLLTMVERAKQRGDENNTK